MAFKKRTLGIPTYRDTPLGLGVLTGEQEVLEGEVYDPQEESLQDMDDRRARARGRQAEGDMPEGEVHDSAEDLFRRPRDEQRRRERDSTEAHGTTFEHRGGQQSVRTNDEELMRQLAEDSAQAQHSFIEQLKESGILEKDATPAVQRKELSRIHQVYASMMVMQCIKPLQQGLSTASIANTVGMGAAMLMLSPNFRTQVGNHFDDAKEGIKAKIADRSKQEAKITKQGSRALAKMSGPKGRPREELSSKWARRLERYENMERGYREPFTARSAAMTEIGLAQAAYSGIRQEGADVEVIEARYKSALTALHGHVADDGLDLNEVSATTRLMAGQMMRQDPEFASMFTETGHGQFVRSGSTQMPIPGTDSTREVWTGDFEDSFTGEKVNGGVFTLRGRGSVEEHRSSMARTIAGEMGAARDPAAFNEVMEQYMIGSATRAHPGGIDSVEEPQARTRLERARTMFASMRHDGISDQDQKLAYMGGYIDAVQAMGQVEPEKMAAWAAQHGDDWQSRVKEKMAHFSDMGEKASGREPRQEQRRSTADSADLGAQPQGPEGYYNTGEDSNLADDLRKRRARQSTRGDRQNAGMRGDDVVAGRFEAFRVDTEDQRQPGA